MAGKSHDFRDCPTAYECRDRLPELDAWMSDDDLKRVPIWKGNRFERGQTYFDLTNPERGPFATTGDEGQPTNFTYVCRADVPEKMWARLITWRRPISPDQGQAIDIMTDHTDIHPEEGGPGEGGPYTVS